MHSHRPGRRHTAGQAIVEFALIATMLAFLMVLAVDFGRAFSAWIAMGNIARAGAQYGTMAASYGPMTAPQMLDKAIQAAQDEQSEIFGTAPTVCARFQSYRDASNRTVWDVIVVVTYDFNPVVRMLPVQELTREARMRVQWVPASMTAAGPKCA